MRRIALALVLLLVVSPVYAQLSVNDIYFSPHGGCTAAIKNELKQAQSAVYVQAFSFTLRRTTLRSRNNWVKSLYNRPD